jgi:hypothetical protein
MHWTTLRRLTACATLLAGFALTCPAGAQDKKDDVDFTPIFNGKDLSGWKYVLEREADPAKAFQVREGTLIVTGDPIGFCYTEKSYKNYVLRFDWKFRRPEPLSDEEKFMGNSGLLLHIQNPTRPLRNGIWPRALLVQTTNRDQGRMFTIGGAEGRYEFDRPALRKVRKPVGEWNTTEITSKDGRVTSKVNGEEVGTGRGELKEGPIGFPSNGGEIFLRNIKIKELP